MPTKTPNILPVNVFNDSGDSAITIGKGLTLHFQRTIRIPDDGKTYPLPPGLGSFPVFKVTDYIDRVPKEWREHGGVFIPMYQREAMWILFSGTMIHAVKVAVGKINALTGKPWDNELHDDPQDYLVAPGQPWLDGIKLGEGTVRQFVAMPLGIGYTVEGQVTGKEDVGGLQVVAYCPTEQLAKEYKDMMLAPVAVADSGGYQGSALRGFNASSSLSVGSVDSFSGKAKSMGLAGGGVMEQKIYPDAYGLSQWDQNAYGRVFVHIVNSADFEMITGMKPPLTPVAAQTYKDFGYPWFDLYDEHLGDVKSSEILTNVKSVKEMDEEKGFGEQQDDSTVEIDPAHIKKIKPNHVIDGDW